MKTHPHHRPALVLTLALMGLPLAQAATTDLASAPLQTSTATLVKPNIFFVLDDSGSMYWDFMPDWVDDYKSTAGLVRNSRFNGVYYDPAVTYTPPMKYDGTSYNSMNASNTTTWTKVPFDGFGIMSAAGAPNTGSNNLFTSSNAGTTQDLTGGNAYYYTFIPGEYCSATNLRSCVTQSAASKDYPYAAYLRWCTSSALSSCQASRIDTDPGTGTTYTYARYPGASITTGSGRNAITTTVPGSNTLVTVSSGTSSYPYPGTSTKASTRSDCAGTTCTYTEEMTNYANWWAYYRTRMQMMKTATSIAFATMGTSYRLGYMSINNNTGSDFLNVSDITTTSGGQKSSWYGKLVAAKPSNSTPLRSALVTAGRYYAGKLSKVNSQSATDPMQYACQRNYTILSTDGYWNESTTPAQVDGSTAIDDQDGSESRPYLDGNKTPNSLADVAEYYYVTDLRSTALGNANNASGTDVSSNSYANKQQRMTTFTLGLGASGYMQYQSDYASATSGDYYDVANGTTTSSSTLASGICGWQNTGACNWPAAVSNKQTTIDDLWHAAVNGRGTYYSATNPAELKSGLANFLNSVNAASSSAAAATLSSQNLSTAANNYVFGTTFCSAKWFGELARYSVNAQTGAIGSTADWSESGAGTDCTDAAGALTTTPLLDRMAYTARNIYTYNPSAASSLIAFQWGSLTSTMQGYFKVAAMGSLSQMCASGSTCLPTASQVDSTTAGTTTGAGGINLVNFLRGDRSNEGTANTKYYLPRTHVLGDIVNSQATYVSAPSFSYTDSGYANFKTGNAGRQGMVYVGANDGMLHAFNADTGAESWAYIPSMLLPSLYKLADKNYASNHVFMVDGAVTKADVYFGGAWHTILVGGLGAGGRGFYALDVTTPTSPSVLWEFTSDTSKGSPYITDADLGYSYGSPVVTKLSDGTWAVLLTSGYNNVSPGSGHGVLWVLNAQTGAIVKKLDNGVGTTSGGGVVTGCSASPCPSGLAKVSAWVDSATNNTAKQVYGGDLYGNVWRFDISALTATGGSASVQLLATLADASGSRQPVTTRPELGYTGNAHMVYVGTGSYLGVSDISTTQQQSIYAIKDPLTTSSTSIYGSPRATACGASLATNCFVKQILTDSGGVRTASSSVSDTLNLATMNGWFEDLPQTGERVNTDPNLQLGTLVYVSNVPGTGGACSVGGSSYLNYVNYTNGLTVTGASSAGKLLSSTGLSSTAVMALTARGQPVAITKSSDGTPPITTDVPKSSAASTTRRVSWRELINGQ